MISTNWVRLSVCMRGHATLLCGLFALLVTLVAGPAWAAEDEPTVGGLSPLNIFVEVVVEGQTPGGFRTGIPELDEAGTLPGVPVIVRGVTAPALYGKPLSVKISPPQEVEMPDPREAAEELDADCPKVISLGSTKRVPPTTLAIVADRDGSFAARYTPTTIGGHKVEVVDAERRFKGDTEFEVADPADFLEEPECDKKKDKTDKSGLEKEAEQLTETADAIVDAVAEKLNRLPASPAKDEAKAKIADLRRAMKQLRAQGKSPNWILGAAHLVTLQGVASEMRVATMGLSARLKEWHGVAKRANARASAVLAEVTRANVFCDQLDVAINGLKAVDFFLSLLIKPGAFFVDWAKENVPPKLVGMIPAARRTKTGTEAIETSWKGITTFAPMRKDMAKGHYPVEFAGGVNQMAYAMSAFMLTGVFERYCQTFQGSLSGKMTAEFRHNGNLYWSYKIEIKGDVILRYPRNATGGQIALTGEFMGNAVSFKSWDNAIPVLFPDLAMGTVIKTIRQDPMGTGDIKWMNESKYKDKKVAGQEVPNFNPLMSVIDQGGVMVKAGFTPNFFRVPVRGELSGNTLRLQLQNATVDFDDARTKVIVFMLPVTALMIYRQDYALPFKGAQFMMFRAMHEAPAEFVVQRAGKVMTIERQFERKKPGDVAAGTYSLNIKACNPSC